MSKARARSEAAILGIDWGSTAIRATICIRKTRELHPIWNRGAVPGHDIRYQTGAFNSTLYVDDRGGIVYTGEVYNGSCTPIPSKWFLCEDRETGNPLLDGLLAKFRGMETKIRRALKAIVRTVFQEVTDFCTDRALHIDEVGLSHPAHWTAQELSSYENLIASAMMESNTKKIDAAVALGSNVKIVLSGGSGKNILVQANLQQACAQLKIDDPFLFYEAVGEKDSFNISKGAALAAVDNITVQEFINRGAAFGFQIGRPLKSVNGSFISWESAATLALDSDGPHYFRKRYSGTTRLKIVCDPLLQASAKWDHVPSAWCYDILELAPPTKGHWEFCLQLHDFGDGKLGLIIRKNKLSWKGKAVLEKMAYGPFPLEYDTSSKCCLINLDRVKTDSTDFESGIFLTEDGKLVPCDPEAVNDQIRDLQKENSDRLRESSGINKSMPQKAKEQQEKQGRQQEQLESKATGKRPRSTSGSEMRGRGKPRKESGRDDERGQEPAYKTRLMKR
ncbi:hypothetical protein COL5a_002829 [Colletotrichum fioriniae]|nr:hypothetical protein COL5a_002829 [Colletotrichum fioriniae]